MMAIFVEQNALGLDVPGLAIAARLPRNERHRSRCAGDVEASDIATSVAGELLYRLDVVDLKNSHAGGRSAIILGHAPERLDRGIVAFESRV